MAEGTICSLNKQAFSWFIEKQDIDHEDCDIEDNCGIQVDLWCRRYTYKEHQHRPLTWDSSIPKVELELFSGDEFVGDYHTSYNGDCAAGWWDAYCRAKDVRTPATNSGRNYFMFVHILLASCLIRIAPDDPEETKHRAVIRKAFEQRQYNVILCQCGCWQGALPRMLFIIRPRDEIEGILADFDIVRHYPSPSWHFFYIIYPEWKASIGTCTVKLPLFSSTFLTWCLTLQQRNCHLCGGT